MLRYTTFAEVSELKHDDHSSMLNCKRLEGLSFRAELCANGGERLELVRA